MCIPELWETLSVEVDEQLVGNGPAENAEEPGAENEEYHVDIAVRQLALRKHDHAVPNLLEGPNDLRIYHGHDHDNEID